MVMDFLIIVASVLLTLGLARGSQWLKLHERIVGSARMAAQDMMLSDFSGPTSPGKSKK
jgi:hypothetical protein